MKVITWNCNMAFRKKFDKILAEKPDVLVLQESENTAKLSRALSSADCTDMYWYGNNPHKGLAVITFNDYTLEVSSDFNHEFEFVVPLILKSKTSRINLFAIWAMPHQSGKLKSYVGQVWGAINYYKEYLDSDTILIGDLNSNAIWDSQRKVGNHSQVVDLLNSKNIFSIYHLKNQIAHGAEKDPTIYLLKQESKPYHLDYCFASKSMIKNNTTIRVGNIKSWLSLSDHMPLIVDKLKAPVLRQG